jgi:ATP-dependent DNA helicase RecG
LVLGKSARDSRERLAILEQTRDGFRIAEADLEQRGLGDVLGVRQSGQEPFRIGQITKDLDIIEESRRRAMAMLTENPNLEGDAFGELRRRVRLLARHLKSHKVDRA